MKILVTGGGGYVGNVLCRYLLDKGYQVVCLDNFHKGQCDAIIPLAINPNFEFRYGDVTVAGHVSEAMQDCDAVIHLAAIVGFPACKAQPSLADAVNVEGTMNVINARNLISRDIPIVYASTGSVYGKVEGICTEESPLNAVSQYGINKRKAEQIMSEEDNTVSFRFATGFGVSPCMRVNLLVNDFVYQALTNGILTIFQADFRRTFIHVRDMAKAFTMGFEHMGNWNHKVYNCGANHLNWTKRELAEYVKQETGCFVHYEEIGTDSDQRDYTVDYSKLENEGFTCDVDMKTGIQELIKVSPILQIRHQYS
jgi:nucleoside-diphosphate-sugar epimerase